MIMAFMCMVIQCLHLMIEKYLEVHVIESVLGKSPCWVAQMVRNMSIN